MVLTAVTVLRFCVVRCYPVCLRCRSRSWFCPHRATAYRLPHTPFWFTTVLPHTCLVPTFHYAVPFAAFTTHTARYAVTRLVRYADTLPALVRVTRVCLRVGCYLSRLRLRTHTTHLVAILHWLLPLHIRGWLRSALRTNTRLHTATPAAPAHFYAYTLPAHHARAYAHSGSFCWFTTLVYLTGSAPRFGFFCTFWFCGSVTIAVLPACVTARFC